MSDDGRGIFDTFDEKAKGVNKFSPRTVAEIHTYDDLDVAKDSHHHSLGIGGTQAAAGNHVHNGSDSPQLMAGVTITGSRGGNVALTNLLNELAVALGFTNNTT